MADLMRVAALTGYFQLMDSLGVDPTPLLKEVGLSRRMLSKPETMISARASTRLLERSAEATGCRTLGLRMAPHRGLADIGVTSLLIEHEPTFREVLWALCRYRNLINPTVVPQIEEMSDGIFLRHSFTLNEANSSKQTMDLLQSSFIRLCTNVISPDWKPEAIYFTYDSPNSRDLEYYRKILRCRTEFNAECNGIVIASRDLERPSIRADAAMAEHARKLIEATMSPEPDNLAQQVEQSIMLLLPSGRATIQAASALLGITVRTLQRSLCAEGTTFSDLLNNARRRLADQHLGNPRTRITDVAGMLGYRSLGAFTYWHQQTYGISPKDRRRKLQPGQQQIDNY